jgi:CubicO group peptidase (beta-lactamase class C family)
MKMRTAGLLLLFTVTACGSAPSPTTPASDATPATPGASASAAPGAAKTAAAKAWTAEKDATVTLASGAHFPVSAGWHVAEHEGRVVLQDPEKQLTLVYVEVTAGSGEAAIAAAWKRHDPSFSLPVRVSNAPPATTWDEVRQIVYVTPDARLVLANARRRGDKFWVGLLDTPKAALDRRGAQMQNSFDGLEVPGAERENLAGKTPAVLDEAKRKDLLAFAEEARQKLQIPGAAIAVVQGGKVVLEAGLGVREIGSREAVTPKTLFLIGSTTKSLSTLLMARAVDEGKLAWEARVKDVYPEFELGDAALTSQLQVQQLVCACTGIPRHDMELLFSFAGQKPDDLLASMNQLKPTTKLGETFQYNNQMVAAGGFLAARAFYPKLSWGEAYDRAMREKILVPLGMKDSTFDLRGAQRRAAMSHDKDARGRMVALPWSMEEFVVPLRPSGGLLSNVGDMSKYLLAELAKGKSVTGVQVASEANVVKRRMPQIKITDDVAYGLGLMGGKVKGLPFVEHGGGTFGQRSTFFYLPEHGVGITVLANGPGPLGSLLKARLIELLFDAKPSSAKSLVFQLEEEAKGVARFSEQLAPPESPPAAKATAQPLVGRYRHPSLGELVVTEKDGELTFDAGEWKTRAAWQKPTDGKTGGPRGVVLLDAPLAGLPLEIREEDGKPVIHLAFQQHAYTFKR